MKRRSPMLLLLVFALGCAGAPGPAELPTWSPQRSQLDPEDEQILLQALILEVPARGLSEIRSGPLEMGVLNQALGTPGVRVLQSPSLLITSDQPAELFVGENVAGESVGLRLEFESTGHGVLTGTFILTDLEKDGSPYKAADATFEVEIGKGPRLVEIPGKRFIPGGDEVFFQDRVFLIAIEGREK